MATLAQAAKPTGPDHLGTDSEAGGRLPPETPHPSSLAFRAVCRHSPEVGAECLNGARSDLCGGHSAMSVPTAIPFGGQFLSMRKPSHAMFVPRHCGSLLVLTGRRFPPHSERSMHSPTTTSGPTPEPAQVMRQLARARIGVAVAQPLVLEHHRIRVRCARHLRREQLRQGHARDRTRTQEPDAKRGLGVPLAIPAEPGTILIVKTASLPKLSRPRSEGLCFTQVMRCGWLT